MKLTKYLIPSTILATSALTCIPVVSSCAKKEEVVTTVTYIGNQKSFSAKGDSGKEILYFKTNAPARTAYDNISFKILNQSNYKLELSISNIEWDSFVNGTFHCMVKWSFSQKIEGIRSESTNFDIRCQYINVDQLSSCVDTTITGFSLTLNQTE